MSSAHCSANQILFQFEIHGIIVIVENWFSWLPYFQPLCKIDWVSFIPNDIPKEDNCLLGEPKKDKGKRNKFDG